MKLIRYVHIMHRLGITTAVVLLPVYDIIMKRANFTFKYITGRVKGTAMSRENFELKCNMSRASMQINLFKPYRSRDAPAV